MIDMDFYDLEGKQGTLLSVNWIVVPRKGEQIDIGNEQWTVSSLNYGRFVDGKGKTIPDKVKVYVGLVDCKQM